MPRFADPHHGLFDFLGEVLVVCPRCAACAVTRQRDAGSYDVFAPRRLTCAACAHVAEWQGGSITSDGEALRDPHFGLTVWLQAPCCGHTLWACNAAHLAFLAGYVGATLRERSRGAHGWSNASLASRLPTWMKARKHRAEVLRVIAQLRERLPAG